VVGVAEKVDEYVEVGPLEVQPRAQSAGVSAAKNNFKLVYALPGYFDESPGLGDNTEEVCGVELIFLCCYGPS